MSTPGAPPRSRLPGGRRGSRVLAGFGIAVCAAAVTGVIIKMILVDDHGPGFPLNSLRKAAKDLRPGGSNAVNGIDLYLDTSASMRGFAYGATDNQSGASSGLVALLTALDSIGEVLVPMPQRTATSGAPLPTDTGKELAGHEQYRLFRFGRGVSRMGDNASRGPSSDTPLLLDAGLGRIDFPAATNAIGKSSFCSKTAWGAGRDDVRRNIDAFFAEPATCLNQVFESLEDVVEPEQRAVLIVTDAEQTAPETSADCPAARNVSPIQARLHTWVFKRNGFAAIASFSLPYTPWKADGVPDKYCACARRELYVYILGPSADTVEHAYAHLAKAWTNGGQPADQTRYMPLAPRPASHFTVEVGVEGTAGGGSGVEPEHRVFKEFAVPLAETLPAFCFRMSSNEPAVLRFRLKGPEVAAVTAGTGTGVAVDEERWAAGTLEWCDAPLRVALQAEKASTAMAEPEGSAKAPEATPTAPKATPSPIWKLADNQGAFEVRRLKTQGTQDECKEPQIAGAGGPLVGTYQGGSVARKDADVRCISEASYQLRRTGEAGAGVYLIELRASMHGGDIGIQTGDPGPCGELNSIRQQVGSVYQALPVARFLLVVANKE